MDSAGRVEFHHGMADRLGYACRLLRKAYKAGAQVVVTADAPLLKELDRLLWTFDEQEFLPHILVNEQPVPQRLQATPVWLTADLAWAPGHRPGGPCAAIGRRKPACCRCRGGTRPCAWNFPGLVARSIRPWPL